jgi:outer membrane protein, heavy metal efflux system
MKTLRWLPALTLPLASLGLAAQSAPGPAQPMTYAAFLQAVFRSNLDAAAQKYNVTSAEAQITINRLFPDPQLSAGVASTELYGPAKSSFPSQSTVGVSWTLELGGKRSARIAVAEDGLKKAQADLGTFLSQLYVTASSAFVDALKARLALDRKRQTLHGLEEVVRLNEIRHRAGDIGGVELAQSRVEAKRFEGEAWQAEADVKAADAALLQLLGGAAPDRMAAQPAGDLNIPLRSPTLADLLPRALAARPDLLSARLALQQASSQKRLAEANRWVDLGLSAGLTHTPPVYPTGLDAGGSPFPSPMPMSNALSFSVSVPIPFSRHQRGELVQAEASLRQAQLQVQSAELKVRTDLEATLAQYEAAARQLGAYRDGVLQDTDKVLEGVTFSYRKGNASLLELINAQRTLNEVYLAYYDALSNHAKALILLDQAAGTQTLTF